MKEPDRKELIKIVRLWATRMNYDQTIIALGRRYGWDPIEAEHRIYEAERENV